jgi:ectoine hydroxylase-related dioxygenase (phytanoyl-CoA dioxygenase family)
MRSIRAPETTAAALLRDKPDEDAVAAYERVGVIVVRGLIEPDWIEALRAEYDRMATLAYDPSSQGGVSKSEREIVMRYGMWREEDCFRAFLFESPIAKAAARMMRSQTATLFEDLLLTEPAGAEARISWHQDEPSWPLSGRMLASVWFSLERVDPQTGALRIVEASHRGPLYQPGYLRADEVGDDILLWTGGLLPDVDADPEAVCVEAEAEPGDALIFHPRTIHGSYGSARTHARRTFTIRFFGDDIRWLPRHRVFHQWIHDLPLKKGDRVTAPQFPRVWDATTPPA